MIVLAKVLNIPPEVLHNTHTSTVLFANIFWTLIRQSFLPLKFCAVRYLVKMTILN